MHQIDEPNRWRLSTPGHSGWKRTARPDDPNKFFMVSADCHANEPANLLVDRIDKKYRDRLPRVEVDADGVKWQISEGWARSRLLDSNLQGEDQIRGKAGASPEERLLDHDRDGVDAEIIFPNKGLTMWATPDPLFAQAQCRIYNDWAAEAYGPYRDRLVPMAALATGDLEGSIEEVKRVGGVAVAVASDEVNRRGINAWKRNRLVQAGADIVVPEYREQEQLVAWLFDKRLP